MTTYADTTNLTEILKNVYGEGITNQFNDEKITYNLFGKSDRKPGGKGYVSEGRCQCRRRYQADHKRN